MDTKEETTVDEQQTEEVQVDGTDDDQAVETDPASADVAEESPTVTRIVEINLTDEEKLDVAERLAAALAKIEELESVKTETAKQYKKKIDAQETAVHELAGQYRKGYRTEEMECPIQFNWEQNEKRILHPITGDVLLTDAVSDRDRQQYMPGFEEQEPQDSAEETEGELMPCINNVCEDELEGKCTKPDGDISCSGYKAPAEEDTDEPSTD